MLAGADNSGTTSIAQGMHYTRAHPSVILTVWASFMNATDGCWNINGSCSGI